MNGYVGPWREPREESVDLYPNLVVCDGRVSGSITVGRSRLPLWAFVPTAIMDGWDTVEAGWSPAERYGFKEGDLAAFLTNLLEMRGEFGRLLLVLADVERLEDEREDDFYQEHAPGETVIDITDGTVHGAPIPGAWWDQADLRQRVVDQLRRCLDALDVSTPTPSAAV